MPNYRMRYSAVPRDRFYVKTYGYLSFAKKKYGQILCSKYAKKLRDITKISTAAPKTALKRALRK